MALFPSFWFLQVSRENDREEEYSDDDHLSNLKLEDRRNLCVAASKFSDIRFDFLDNNVSEAQPFHFKYTSNSEETNLAIHCPTFPKLYLRGGGTETELQLVILRDPLDDYKFETERNEALSVVHRKSWY